MSTCATENIAAAEKLHDTIHDLSQPLTTLIFVLEMGRLQSKPEAWLGALNTAVQECRRAVAALDQVRVAAGTLAPLPDDEEEN
jgi:hypothetical protein